LTAFRTSIVICVVFFAAVASDLAGASIRSATTTCPKVTGPKWVVGPLSGTKYTIVVVGASFSCGSATKWVKKFVAVTFPTAALSQKLKGPTGYRCASNPDKNRRAASGNCAISSSNAFSWIISP